MISVYRSHTRGRRVFKSALITSTPGKTSAVGIELIWYIHPDNTAPIKSLLNKDIYIVFCDQPYGKFLVPQNEAVLDSTIVTHPRIPLSRFGMRSVRGARADELQSRGTHGCSGLEVRVLSQCVTFDESTDTTLIRHAWHFGKVTVCGGINAFCDLTYVRDEK